MRAELNGGTPTPITTPQNTLFLGVSEDSVYWSTHGQYVDGGWVDGGEALMKAALDGDTPVKLIQTLAYPLTTDSTNLYFSVIWGLHPQMQISSRCLSTAGRRVLLHRHRLGGDLRSTRRARSSLFNGTSDGGTPGTTDSDEGRVGSGCRTADSDCYRAALCFISRDPTPRVSTGRAAAIQRFNTPTGP